MVGLAQNGFTHGNPVTVAFKGRKFVKIMIARGLVVLLYCFGVAGMANAESKVGIVVMHGKWGSPDGHTMNFAQAMTRAGYMVETPEMPWSGRRLYDTGVDGVVSEIGAAMKSLKDKGATKVCLAGHSMGAAGAILYAGRVQTDCVIALAPGHNPEGRVLRERAQPDLTKAKEMVAKGEADEKAWFEDYNSGNRTKKVKMSAKVFIEYFDGDGPMNMAHNASRILPGTYVLWVVGREAPVTGS